LLAGFVVFYTALAIVDGFLMARTIRLGPDHLGFWPRAKPADGTGRATAAH
jgi:cytochrome d ubiquinol oxidase subunit I